MRVLGTMPRKVIKQLGLCITLELNRKTWQIPQTRSYFLKYNPINNSLHHPASGTINSHVIKSVIYQLFEAPRAINFVR